MMLDTVQPARRLGTCGLRPVVSTGWNETADGLNSRRVLFWVMRRGTVGCRASPSAWHLKQASYSEAAWATGDPDALTPLTRPRLGSIVGACAVPCPMVCGS